jgi:hypothetical protein
VVGAGRLSDDGEPKVVAAGTVLNG